jgi:hypothetical protein
MTDQADKGEQTTESEPLSLDVPVAGAKYYGFTRAQSYAAVKKGAIPTIRIGNRLKVPVRAMEARFNSVK